MYTDLPVPEGTAFDNLTVPHWLLIYILLTMYHLQFLVFVYSGERNYNLSGSNSGAEF